jgi:hypothetical protein
MRRRGVLAGIVVMSTGGSGCSSDVHLATQPTEGKGGAATDRTPQRASPSRAASQTCESEFESLLRRVISLRNRSKQCDTASDCVTLKLPDWSLTSFQRRHPETQLALRNLDSHLRLPQLEVMYHEPVVFQVSAVATQLSAEANDYRTRCDDRPDVELPYESTVLCDRGACTLSGISNHSYESHRIDRPSQVMLRRFKAP